MLPPAAAAGVGGAGGSAPGRGAPHSGDAETVEYETVDREVIGCRLTSVRELRAAVREDMHHELTEIFANHTFVGVVDERRRLAAIQGGVKLYLVDYGRVCAEYFYQLGLTDFGNFGVIRFSPPLDLKKLLTLAAQQEKDAAATGDGDNDNNDNNNEAEEFDVAETVNLVAKELIDQREMLLEYFSLEISPAGELLSIPLLVKGYTPAIVKLPRFLLRLGPHVCWTEEKPCFENFLRELASFYVPEQLPAATPKSEDSAADGEVDIDDDIKARRSHVLWAVEHVLFPAFKARLVATKSLMQGAILEVANLKGLYRVFERC
jgi:DNA mismatch repair protein MLH1